MPPSVDISKRAGALKPHIWPRIAPDLSGVGPNGRGLPLQLAHATLRTGPTSTAGELIEAADRGRYQAKATRRNRVGSAPAPA